MASAKLYLTELPEETQKHVRKSIKMARSFLRAAEGRLAGYESGNAEANTENVYKTIEDLREASVIAEAMLNQLAEAHGLGDSMKGIPDKHRKDFADILAGTFGETRK